MSEKSETEILSRRKLFSILGLATLALAVPSTVLTVSRAEAQAPSTPPTPQTGATATPQAGWRQRRLARRQARTMRRLATRQARTERRQARRQALLQRRQTLQYELERSLHHRIPDRRN
jgi:anaerobic selenocysteine-containing dehydrogenase